ncbi:MAG: protein kinase [Chloroflexi bacterium]|nr:protein kinase [Chloroflexota bacterium]
MAIIKDRYELGPKISEGGMGVVYRAMHLPLSRPVAMKFIHVTNADFGERFKREAQAIARLAHPNIVVVHDFDHDEEHGYFMVMELLDGITLSAMLKQARDQQQFLPLKDVLHIMRGIGEGLHYAHQQGVIHRDVKPGNVIITNENRVVVTDFGIAKMVSEASITGPDTIMGTPYYFAPEQATGDRVDHRVDIYALGAVFYELLTNRVPYDADTTMSVIAKHINAPIPNPLDERPDLPLQVKTIIDKAMAKDASQRYANMDDFLADLDKIESDREKTTVIERETTSPSLPDQKTITPAPITITKTRSLPLRWIAAGVIGLLVIVVAGLMLISGGDSNENEDETEEVVQRTYNFEPAREGEYLYLISDFEREDVDIERRIADALSSSRVNALLGEDFRLEQLDFVVPSEADAEAIANDTQAVVIIWGLEDATGLEVIFSSPLYPEKTIRELKFLVPAGEGFNQAILDELPVIVPFASYFMSDQQILRNSDFSGIDFDLLEGNSLEIPADDMYIRPSRQLERQIIDIDQAFVNHEHEVVDDITTELIDVMPNDPVLYFLRYTVNSFFIDQPERARADADTLNKLLPTSPLTTYLDSGFALLNNDYESLIAASRAYQGDDPISRDLLQFYEIIARIVLGEFEQADQLLKTTDLVSIAASLGLPANEAFNALLSDVKGDEESGREYRQALAANRSIEEFGGSFTSLPFSTPPFGFIFWVGYALEETSPVLSGFAYNVETPGFEEHFLLMWRKGVVAERNEDYEKAAEYYEIAIENAPVPFPVASYQLAVLVHEQGLDGDVCALLAEAESQANTNPEFYSVLIEKIAAARTEFGCS